MSKIRAKHSNCSVVDCIDQQKSLHRPPASEDKRAEWIKFIFDGNVPVTVSKNLYVCANHFVSECFSNLGQYNAGLAERLTLKEGSVPTIRGKSAVNGNASTSGKLAAVHHVACQTDPPQRCNVGTQLSMRTLQPHFRSIGVGTSTVGFSASQPFVTSTLIKRPCKRPRFEVEEEEEDAVKSRKPRILPHSRRKSSSPVHKTPTYLVYENCLLELFEVCPVCQRVSDVLTRSLGTFLSVQQKCPHCQFSRKWNSQPILGSTPAGNLQLSAALYATGASLSKLGKIFRAMQLKMCQYDTFQKHTEMYIEPAIVHMWKTVQDVILERLSQQQNVILGGDLREGLPGRSAEFGNYTMMDLRSNTVIDLQLIQSSEVGGSSRMEKEGLRRSLSLLDASGVTLDSMVTDCHPQIDNILREANITHYYDVCHMEKGLSKKLVKISQKKDCDKLKKWLHRIKKHLYWTAASSTSGPERVAKWSSILNHVQDCHIHKDPVFPQCLHPQIISRDNGKWLTAGTPAFCRLEKVLTDKSVLKEVEKLSPHYQTSSLKTFHRVILRFVPKNVALPFLGMLCRLYLAALHFNENSGYSYPPPSEPTFNYVDQLLDLIFEKVFQDPGPYVEEMLKIHIPEEHSVQLETPGKQEVMAM